MNKSVVKEEGYEYRGYKLGQLVRYHGKIQKIVGFDESSNEDVFILISSDPYISHLAENRLFVTSCLNYRGGAEWVCPSEISICDPTNDEMGNDLLAEKEYLATYIATVNRSTDIRGNFFFTSNGLSKDTVLEVIKQIGDDLGTSDVIIENIICLSDM